MGLELGIILNILISILLKNLLDNTILKIKNVNHKAPIYNSGLRGIEYLGHGANIINNNV